MSIEKNRKANSQNTSPVKQDEMVTTDDDDKLRLDLFLNKLEISQGRFKLDDWSLQVKNDALDTKHLHVFDLQVLAQRARQDVRACDLR